HTDGPRLADPQAVHLAAEHPSGADRLRPGFGGVTVPPAGRGGRQSQFLEAGLEVGPHRVGDLDGGALGCRLAGAQEDVPLHGRDGEGVGDVVQSFRGVHVAHASDARDRPPQASSTTPGRSVTTPTRAAPGTSIEYRSTASRGSATRSPPDVWASARKGRASNAPSTRCSTAARLRRLPPG